MSAGTVKQGWDALPAHLRQQVVDHVGAEVVDAVTRQGGFSPGVAVRLRFADATRAFLKATPGSLHPEAAAHHRREVVVTGAIDDPAVPRLLTSLDDGDWVALLFAHAPGDHPRLPWSRRPFEVVAAELEQLHARLTPAPLDAPGLAEHGDVHLGRWRDLADDPARAARHGLTAADVAALQDLTAAAGGLTGTTLLHGDLRADQILLRGMRATFVDWAHACIGPGWADLALMIPSMLAADRRLDVDTVVGLAPELRTAPPAALRAVVAGMAGYLLWQSDEPDPPGLPTVRAFQRVQAHAVLPWLLGPSWSAPAR